MTKFSVGIDIGTGSCKAVAIDSKGNVQISIQKFYNSANENYILQDPEIIWKAFIFCLKSICLNLKTEIRSITLSSCMHSLILIDKDDLAISPVITWADNISEGVARKLRLDSLGKLLYQQTGTPIHAMSPLCKILWFRDNKPELFNKTYKFISIKEFIWFRLFKIFQIDYSIASATGLFNINTRKWNPLSILTCSIDESRLSKIVSTKYIRTDFKSDGELSFLNNLPICIGSSDGCLANIGSKVLKPGQAAITLGTSGAVRLTSPAPFDNFTNMIFNYVLDKNTFVSGGPVNNGGNVVQWLISTFMKTGNTNKRDFKLLFSQIKKIPPGSGGLLFLPYLNGERAPIWDENAAGAFIGIKKNHTRYHFLRAGIEGICFALISIIKILENNNKLIEEIHISGGLINNDIWTQMLADITGKKVLIFYQEDASAIGAAIFGLSASKIIKDYKKLKRKPLKIIFPDPNNYQTYKKYYMIYKDLYKILKKSIENLNRISD